MDRLLLAFVTISLCCLPAASAAQEQGGARAARVSSQPLRTLSARKPKTKQAGTVPARAARGFLSPATPGKPVTGAAPGTGEMAMPAVRQVPVIRR